MLNERNPPFFGESILLGGHVAIPSAVDIRFYLSFPRTLSRVINLTILWVGLICASCTSSSSPKVARTDLPDCSPGLASRLILEGAAVVEIHETGYNQPMIPGAQVTTLDALENLFSGFLGSYVVIYSRDGELAIQGKTRLVSAGFSVTNLGGYEAWKYVSASAREVLTER